MYRTVEYAFCPLYCQVSVELYRTQEDLSREKHSNELKMKSMVTEFEQTLSKESKREEVLQEKADSAEKEVTRLTQILNKIIEQGKMGEGVDRLNGM